MHHATMDIPEKSEKDFQVEVMRLAVLHGWKVVHFRKVRVQRSNGSAYWVTPYDGDDGFPDLVVAKNGWLIIAELKTDSGRTSSGQESWLDAMTLPKGVESHRLVTVWRPSMWDKIERCLTRFGGPIAKK